MTWQHRPTRDGASAYGSHFNGTWNSCERMGFFQFRAPHPRGGEGLSTTHKSKDLLFGIAMHEGMAAYYQSGWRDGKYDLAAAVDAFKLSMTQSREQWYSAEIYNDFMVLGHSMLRAYWDWYGPEAARPEYPEIRVATAPDGTPIIEREYAFPLEQGAVFTARVDLAVYRGEWLCLMEHKTTSRYRVSTLLSEARWNSQFTGEYLVLSRLMGDQPIHGIIVNAMVKDSTPRGKTPPFVRDYVGRSDGLIDTFVNDLSVSRARLGAIHDQYDKLVAGGMDPWEAGRRAYPARGMSNGACHRFSPCAYLEMCLAPGREAILAESFNPSITIPQEPDETD